MQCLSLIAAVDAKGGIGINNQLLCHLPADLQHFKTTTMGKPIIMGRLTFESIGKALPGRQNIVISQTLKQREGIVIVASLDEALSLLKDCNEVMVIGGAQLYREAIHKANRLYITYIQHSFQADVFFPLIDKTLWHCEKEEHRVRDEKNAYDLIFRTYSTDIKKMQKLVDSSKN